MVKDRSLNIAILISVSWHLIAIFSFSPLLLPVSMKPNSVSVSFLGSILEKIGTIKEIPVFDRISENNNFKKDALARPDIASNVVYADQQKEQFSLIGVDYDMRHNWQIYDMRERPEIDLSNFLLKGEARGREIFYKPELTPAVILPSDFNSTYIMNIKFKISKDGFVKDPQCIISSGFPEIDRAGIRYVRKWRFAPSFKDSQEAIVRISMEAR